MIKMVELDIDGVFLLVEVLASMMVDAKHNPDRLRMIPDDPHELIILLLRFMEAREAKDEAMKDKAAVMAREIMAKAAGK